MIQEMKPKIKEVGVDSSFEKKAVWKNISKENRIEVFNLAEKCKSFLNKSKTERLTVETLKVLAEKKGFKNIEENSIGSKFYMIFRNKAIALGILGKKGLETGLRIIGSHIDSPRLDLKMKPLFENCGLAFFKTHYYGGIKKYQWLARPLAISGVVCTIKGETIRFYLGDKEEDPVFTILDLLPHLGRKIQNQKKVSEAFDGEKMNVLLAGLPLDEEKKENLIKLHVLKFLRKNYNISESDLISAELEVVPAGVARDVGLDRAFIGAYGQDDRISTFCAQEALCSINNPEKSCLCFFVDKEEIGSEGSTSANSRFLELVISKFMTLAKKEPKYFDVIQTLSNSLALSADVTAALDPDYKEVHDVLNAAYMGNGITLTKYTGHGGKYGASDANPEYIAWLRKIWKEDNIIWQAAGMGKVDEGGGGTIAKFLAAHGMEVVDVGPPLLSMHSPFEISHKADIWMTYKAFNSFFVNS